SSSCQVLRFLPEGGRPTRIESGAVVPVGVARHPDGSIWVTDAQRHALIRIGADGTEPQVVLQGPGTGARQLFRPRSVQVSAKGSVWVLDHGNHRGVVLTPIEGEPLSTAAVRHFGSRPYLPVEVKPSPEEGGR
ncbi:MAG: hypothetical protein AAEJ04_10525, partial [Planctomycetota bacterium]